MRLSWFGDVADVPKAGISTALAGPDLHLGVIWYLTTHAPAKPPLTGYLKRRAEFEACDAGLFARFHELNEARSNGLDLERAQRLLFPDCEIFFGRPLATSHLPREARLEARNAWFRDAQETTARADLVLLDPDTGLLQSGRKAENKRGEEYVTLAEVDALNSREQSVLLVQFGAPQNFEAEPIIARERLARLREHARAQKRPEPFGLWWRDGHKVGLLVVPVQDHQDVLRTRAQALLAHPGWTKKLSWL